MAGNLAVVKNKDIVDEIGRLFRDGVNSWIEVGRLLIMQKKELDHGQWLPWLAANEKKLGFKERAAQRLIALAENPSLATDLWGHDKAKKAQKASVDEDGGDGDDESANALANFRAACNQWLPKMTDADMQEAVEYFRQKSKYLF